MKNIILILSSFFLFSCSDIYQPAVVSARKEATQIGLEIMKNGGNAYDAMIATHLALAVVHPTAGNIGGGGFFVYHDKDGSSGSLDFREMAPGNAYKDMYLDENGDVIPDMSTLGGAAVGVPGSISAIYEIHAKFGSLPIEDLFKPAIDLAEALPTFFSIEIIITGLFVFSFILDATIPITPSCQFSPLITITGSE